MYIYTYIHTLPLTREGKRRVKQTELPIKVAAWANTFLSIDKRNSYRSIDETSFRKP
jgi:hypothetical protein